MISFFRGVFEGLCRLYNVSAEYSSYPSSTDSHDFRVAINERIVSIGLYYDLPGLYKSQPDVCLCILGIFLGLVFFLVMYCIGLCFRVCLNIIASLTGVDVLRDYLGIDDSPDELRENPFWAGTHERRRIDGSAKKED